MDRWPYLKDINLPYIEVDLLIGSDVPMALEPQEVKRSDGGGPYAVRTLLGWTLNGPLGIPNSSNHTANRIQSHANLNLQFERFCEMEFNDSQFSTEKGMSQEDKRALTIMEESAELRDGHYEIALPWKVFPPELPNNKIVAEHRLGLLKKRLIKDPGLHFDCASKFQNTSLNQRILQGPDLSNSLTGVLTRFRVESTAIMADIEKMFYQVHVPTEDAKYLRFLWWPGGDMEKAPEEF